jgi:hypothetical protein
LALVLVLSPQKLRAVLRLLAFGCATAAAGRRSSMNGFMDWLLALRTEARIAVMRNFAEYMADRDNKTLSFNEVVFALKRGESLHVRTPDGRWLFGFSWYSNSVVKTNFAMGTTQYCEMEYIPALGRQEINKVPVNVLFFKPDVDKKQ